MYEKIDLAPATSSVTTHPGVFIPAFEAIAFEVIIVSASGTPALTYKVQGSPDDPSVVDASAHWYDLGYITDASDTIATTARVFSTPSAGEAEIMFLSNPVARRYQRFRLVTTVVTTTTYRAEAYRIV